MASHEIHSGAVTPRPAQVPRLPEGEARPSPQIWSIAGGKGGVGRTLIATNLGITLTRMGHRVVLLDLDLHGGNLHNFLGYTRLPCSLTDFASGTKGRLTDLLLETSSKRLRLIGGLQRGELRYDPVAFVRRVAAQLADLPTEFVIIDCGSGKSPGTIASFACASLGLLVTTPEPTAVESASLFAEAHLRACLAHALRPEDHATIDARLRTDGIDPDTVSFRSLMSHVGRIDADAHSAISRMVRLTRLEFLVNQTYGDGVEDAAAAIVSGFRKCFGIKLRIAGTIEHDPAVLKAVQKRRPLAKQFPNATATKEIARAANRLVAVRNRPIDEAEVEWEDLSDVDLYRVLEIQPKASCKEVKAAYQRLRRAYDPESTYLAPLIDVPTLRDTLSRIEDAYRTLIFLETRKEYDRRLGETEGASPAGTSPARAGPVPARTNASTASEPRTPRRCRDTGSEDPREPAALELAGSGNVSLPQPAVPRAEPVVAGADPDASGRAPASGRQLREERTRQNQTIESIARKTKIRPGHLHAIEDERFIDLPAPVYVRGFLKEYALCLGLPGDEVACHYMERYRAWQDSDPGGPAPAAGRPGG